MEGNDQKEHFRTLVETALRSLHKDLSMSVLQLCKHLCRIFALYKAADQEMMEESKMKTLCRKMKEDSDPRPPSFLILIHISDVSAWHSTAFIMEDQRFSLVLYPVPYARDAILLQHGLLVQRRMHLIQRSFLTYLISSFYIRWQVRTHCLQMILQACHPTLSLKCLEHDISLQRCLWQNGFYF
jgi:hypothetical protein